MPGNLDAIKKISKFYYKETMKTVLSTPQTLEGMTDWVVDYTLKTNRGIGKAVSMFFGDMLIVIVGVVYSVWEIIAAGSFSVSMPYIAVLLMVLLFGITSHMRYRECMKTALLEWELIKLSIFAGPVQKNTSEMVDRCGEYDDLTFMDKKLIVDQVSTTTTRRILENADERES